MFPYWSYLYSNFRVAPMFCGLEGKNSFSFQIGIVGEETFSHAALLLRGGWLANLKGRKIRPLDLSTAS